jgi:anti-anti-sigma factor
MPETNVRKQEVDFSSRPRLVVGVETEQMVISLSGEQDCSNSAELMQACAAAISCDDSDLVIDIRRVEFMSAATVDVIVSIAEVLGRRNRDLVVRNPSAASRHLLEICGLSDLIESSTPSPSPTALASWVAVPTTPRETVVGETRNAGRRADPDHSTNATASARGGMADLDRGSSRSMHPCAAEARSVDRLAEILDDWRDGS